MTIKWDDSFGKVVPSSSSRIRILKITWQTNSGLATVDPESINNNIAGYIQKIVRFPGSTAPSGYTATLIHNESGEDLFTGIVTGGNGGISETFKPDPELNIISPGSLIINVTGNTVNDAQGNLWVYVIID
jgi:hypothetical protein